MARASDRCWSIIRFEGGRLGPLTRRSRSEAVKCWVPEIHWMFEIVGRGGMVSSGLIRVSFGMVL